jgi:beta-glucanase (GH16 family)
MSRLRQVLPALVAALALAGIAAVLGLVAPAGAASADTCASAAPPSFLPPTAQLAFCDDFDGTALDTTKWYPNIRWASTCGLISQNQGVLSAYTPRATNVSVSGGSLHLVAQRESYSCDGTTFYPFTSGVVTTGGAAIKKTQTIIPAEFTCTPGCYVEVRFLMPPGAMLWPAIWMLGYPGETYTGLGPGHEIDILEQWDKWTRWHHSVHLLCNGSVNSSTKGVNAPDTTSSFQTVALWWQSSSLSFYENGAKKWTYTGCGIPNYPMFILINDAVGGLARDPSPSDPFPRDMQVDYVRVWTGAGS